MKKIIKKVEYEVDPHQGIAGMFAAVKLKGYQLVRVIRKGKNAVVYYEKEI